MVMKLLMMVWRIMMKAIIMFILQLILSLTAGYIADFFGYDIIVYWLGILSGIIVTVYVFVESDKEEN